MGDEQRKREMGVAFETGGQKQSLHRQVTVTYLSHCFRLKWKYQILFSFPQLNISPRLSFVVMQNSSNQFSRKTGLLSAFKRQRNFQWVNKLKHAIIWIMLSQQPVEIQFDAVMLASYINYVNDNGQASCKPDELSRFVAWLTPMSAPFPPHALMALEDKWVALLVMTHNDTACPLQWTKPIFFHCVSPGIGIGAPQAIYSRPRQAKRMWRANVF